MEPEIKRLKNWLGVNHLPENAVEFLAALDPSLTEKIATLLSQEYTKEKCRIVALASFIPELARSESRAEGGVKALQNLVKIAYNLQDAGHEVRVVELVAGSRVEEFNSRKTAEGKDNVSVSFFSPDGAQLALVRNLRKVVSRIDLDRELRLAIELEPGPFFVLGNHETLLDLAERIDEPRTWMEEGEKEEVGRQRANRVGFNLDISHWNIAGIDPDWIRLHPEAELIRKRIVHAHVGGHNRTAHFGDAPLVDGHGKWLNPPEDLLPWIQLLEEIGRDKNTLFSGHVSQEMEAARSTNQVVRSYKALCKIKQPR